MKDKNDANFTDNIDNSKMCLGMNYTILYLHPSPHR